jgi:hypothetical protein
MPELVTVARYRNLPEAWMAKGKLDSAGLPCFLIDDNMVRMNWFYANLLGGIKLQVRAEYASTAIDLLQELMPSELPAPGDKPYVQPRCPRCESLNVRYVAVHSLSYFMLFLSLPVFISAKRWECENCGARWKWEGPGEYDNQQSPPVANV